MATTQCQAPHDLPPLYRSAIPFRTFPVRAAAIHCSDGRVGAQIDEFLHHTLDTPLFDRLAVPGGPACLTYSSPALKETMGVKEQLLFLARAHHLRHVILIAHAPCAFYRKRLRVSARSLLSRQMEDLKEAARVVGTIGPVIVDAYMTRVVRARVEFYPVSV